jgi:uncharacterized protein with GYD domain
VGFHGEATVGRAVFAGETLLQQFFTGCGQRDGALAEREGGWTMATYVILMNLTEKGIKEIKDAPARIAQVEKALEAAGGKMLAFYCVMGAYDYVSIAEGPGDETALAQLLALGMAGNVRTTTLKAFTREEFAAILKKLP